LFFSGLGIALPCNVEQTIEHVQQTIPNPNFDVFFLDMKTKRSGITWRDIVDLKKLKGAVDVLKNKMHNEHYKKMKVPDDLLTNKKYADMVTMFVEDEDEQDDQNEERVFCFIFVENRCLLQNSKTWKSMIRAAPRRMQQAQQSKKSKCNGRLKITVYVCWNSQIHLLRKQCTLSNWCNL
jgi:hypothetical protein